MRQLHPTGSKERMLAYGTYRYAGSLFDRPGLLIEDWSLHRLPDSTVILRADRRTEFGFELLEALCAAPADGGAVLRFDIGRYPLQVAAIEKRGSFMLDDGLLTISTQLKGAALETRLEKFDPIPYSLAPVGLAARGLLARFTLGSNPRPVLTVHDVGESFLPLMMQAQAAADGERRTFTTTQGTVEADAFRLVFDKMTARYWVDARGVVLAGEHEAAFELTAYVQGM